MDKKEQPYILAVDDDEHMLKLIATMLKYKGYQVITASDGAQALDQFRQDPADLVLLDVLMPGMDGFALCQHLRQESSVPIVMLTALSRPADMVHSLDLGADDFISKPFHYRELTARVEAALRRVGSIDQQA